jgi:hypothetical protein
MVITQTRTTGTHKILVTTRVVLIVKFGEFTFLPLMDFCLLIVSYGYKDKLKCRLIQLKQFGIFSNGK